MFPRFTYFYVHFEILHKKDVIDNWTQWNHTGVGSGCNIFNKLLKLSPPQTAITVLACGFEVIINTKHQIKLEKQLMQCVLRPIDVALYYSRVFSAGPLGHRIHAELLLNSFLV